MNKLSSFPLPIKKQQQEGIFVEKKTERNFLSIRLIFFADLLIFDIKEIPRPKKQTSETRRRLIRSTAAKKEVDGKVKRDQTKKFLLHIFS